MRAGLLFVLTFSVQNTSGETRRILFVPPSTPVFSLNYEPVGGLAPGLDARAEVEFQLPVTDEADDLGSPFALEEIQEYADKFTVISGKDRVRFTFGSSANHLRRVGFRRGALVRHIKRLSR